MATQESPVNNAIEEKKEEKKAEKKKEAKKRETLQDKLLKHNQLFNFYKSTQGINGAKNYV